MVKGLILYCAFSECCLALQQGTNSPIHTQIKVPLNVFEKKVYGHVMNGSRLMATEGFLNLLLFPSIHILGYRIGELLRSYFGVFL